MIPNSLFSKLVRHLNSSGLFKGCSKWKCISITKLYAYKVPYKISNSVVLIVFSVYSTRLTLLCPVERLLTIQDQCFHDLSPIGPGIPAQKIVKTLKWFKGKWKYGYAWMTRSFFCRASFYQTHLYPFCKHVVHSSFSDSFRDFSHFCLSNSLPINSIPCIMILSFILTIGKHFFS